MPPAESSRPPLFRFRIWHLLALLIPIGVLASWHAQSNLATATVQVMDVTYSANSQTIDSISFYFLRDDGSSQYAGDDRYQTRHWIVFDPPVSISGPLKSGQEITFRYRAASGFLYQKQLPLDCLMQTIGIPPKAAQHRIEESLDRDAFEQLYGLEAEPTD